MGIRWLWIGVLVFGCGKVEPIEVGVDAATADGASSCDASFTTSPSPMQDQQVVFTPTTAGAMYAWTFDGGIPASSTDAMPTVTFASSGDHLVTLNLDDGACTNMSSRTVTVAPCGAVSGTQTFNYTGAMQQFTVPSCISSLTIDAYGAAGGDASVAGGPGGHATGTTTMVAGAMLTIMVGGQGTAVSGTGNAAGFPGGFNGGGSVNEYVGWSSQAEGLAGTGGGASDVRVGGTTLANRIIVAGGGGGSAVSTGVPIAGGVGGGASGGTAPSGSGASVGGGGGTQIAGGTAANSLGAYPNTPGTLGVGGNAYRDGSGSGGGGGGYYGGGGGQFAGGGGGSSFTGTLTNASTVAGARTGNGMVVLTWQ